jgi:hypothetical protein
MANYIPVRKELKLRIEDGIGVVCNAHDFRVSYLNKTALTVFQLIDGKSTIMNIIQRFLEKIDVDRNVFEKDLIELLRDFQWRKLITLKRKI